MVYSPCKGCDDRCSGCHNICNAYIEYKRKLADEKDAVRKQKDLFTVNAQKRMKGREML